MWGTWLPWFSGLTNGEYNSAVSLKTQSDASGTKPSAVWSELDIELESVEWNCQRSVMGETGGHFECTHERISVLVIVFFYGVGYVAV